MELEITRLLLVTLIRFEVASLCLKAHILLNGQFLTLNLDPMDIMDPDLGYRKCKPAEIPSDCSVMPNRIRRVPGSQSLIFDGLPYCDALFISMPSLQYYDLEIGEHGP